MSFDLRSITQALEPIRKEYWDDVCAIAREVVAHSRGEMDDAICESVDGSWWITYTYAACAALMVSDNADAYLDDMETEDAFTDGVINWSALAFAAMRRDVTEQVQSLLDTMDEEDAD
jgi:hypothetical protein